MENKKSMRDVFDDIRANELERINKENNHLRTVNAKLVEALEEMLKVTKLDVPCSENSITIARGMSINALKLAKGE